MFISPCSLSSPCSRQHTAPRVTIPAFFRAAPNWRQILSGHLACLDLPRCSPLAEGGNVGLLFPSPGLSELSSGLSLEEQPTCISHLPIPYLPLSHCPAPGNGGLFKVLRPPETLHATAPGWKVTLVSQRAYPFLPRGSYRKNSRTIWTENAWAHHWVLTAVATRGHCA